MFLKLRIIEGIGRRQKYSYQHKATEKYWLLYHRV
jgi:hypothetical protein